MIEYGAINITGFRIVDATRPHVKDFLANWHRQDPATSQGAGRESISVRICSRISSASLARPRRHFFLRLSFVGGFYTLSRFASRGETTLRAKSSECLPSAVISSRWIEHFLRFLRFPRVPVVDRRWATTATVRKFRTRNENQTRIVADSFARAISCRSLARVSLCAQRLETKLVKQHPHVETWTFQRL